MTLTDPGTGLDIVMKLQIGGLDPVETLSGQESRLNNLGYAAGTAGDAKDAVFLRAVRAFQTDNKLDVDGDCGPKTQAKLQRSTVPDGGRPSFFLDPEGSEPARSERRPARPLDIAAAPATGTETNTIRLPLLTVACWRMDDARFAFNSSFIMPTAQKELALLRQVVEANPGSPLSIFGHADPTGDDAYNKRLSGRRARAVFGALTRDTGIWESLFKDPGSEEGWGTEAIQVMLDALGVSPGAIDGKEGPKTTAAVKQFQQDNGLGADGKAGPDTRAKLFEKYMDFICTARFEGDDQAGREGLPGRRDRPERQGRLPGLQRVQPGARVLEGRGGGVSEGGREGTARHRQPPEPPRDGVSVQEGIENRSRQVAVPEVQRRHQRLPRAVLL